MSTFTISSNDYLRTSRTTYHQRQEQYHYVLSLRQGEPATARCNFTPLAGAAFSGNDCIFGKVVRAYERGARDVGASVRDADGGKDKPDPARKFPEQEVVAQVKAVLKNRKRGGGKTRGKSTIPTEVTLLLPRTYGPEALNSAVAYVEDWENEYLDEGSEACLSVAVEKAELDNPIRDAKEAAKEGAFDGLK